MRTKTLVSLPLTLWRLPLRGVTLVGLVTFSCIQMRSLELQQRWWDRDRRRRVAEMLAREAAGDELDQREAMARQLAEIWALPEIAERHSRR